MSVAQTLDINSYRIVDPRLSQKQDTRSFQVGVGGSQSTIRREPANSSSNNSTIVFNITPNSPNNIVDRCFIIENKFRLTNFNAVSAEVGGADPKASPFEDFFKGQNVALRSFSNIVATTSLSINGLTITQETRYLHHVFTHFLKPEEQNKFQTLTPSLACGDYVQDYNVSANSVYSELAERQGSSPYRQGRGLHNFNVVGFGGNNGWDGGFVEFTSYDLVTMSPLVHDSQLFPGFTNCTSLQLSFTLQNLQRILANNRYAGGAITGFDVQISESYVHLTEITMPVYMSIPPSVSLSYYDIQRQTSGQVAVQPKATATIRSNTYQLNTIPSRIIVYVKEQESSVYGGNVANLPVGDKVNYQNAIDTMTSIPDCYGAIENIEINFNNSNSLLSSASQAQLFQLSSRNGVDLTFQEFIGRSKETGRINLYVPGQEEQETPLVGSILCLDMGRDLPQDPTSIPATSCNSNFSVQVRFNNPSERAITYELTILYVYAGVLVISPGSAFKYNSLLTRDEVLSLPLLEGDCDDRLKGGDFVSSVMKNSKEGLSRLGDSWKSAKEAVKALKGDGMAASGMKASGGSLYESGAQGRAATGMVGGKAKSKKSLSDYYG